MKKYIPYFCISALLLTASCSKKDNALFDPPANPAVPAPVPVPVPAAETRQKKIDSLRLAIKGSLKSATVISDSVWAENSGITFNVQAGGDFITNEFAVAPAYADRIYPGALLAGNTLSDRQFTAVTGYNQKPVVIYSISPLFAVMDRTVIPSLAVTNTFLKESLKPSTGGQIESLTYTAGSPFSNYSEISINTRNSSDYRNIVIKNPGDHGHIKKKNGYYVNYDLSVFTVTIDPVNLTDIATANPVIVSGVTYGKKAILTIESDATFNEINAAYQSASQNRATDAETKLLNESTITTDMLGFNASDIQQINSSTGYTRVSLFTKSLNSAALVTATNYGVPTKFSCHTATDFSIVKHGFGYKLDFPVN